MSTPAGPSVVALGGGHGLAATLRAARRYAGRLTAVVSVADDGGSSGRLRNSLPLPPPGDLRKCLVAL
ncbi:MAG: gluconeogenesis factor YvcK family protein, partial [Acidimicrobiales bacterium]